jgi:hypothetical protein
VLGAVVVVLGAVVVMLGAAVAMLGALLRCLRLARCVSTGPHQLVWKSVRCPAAIAVLQQMPFPNKILQQSLVCDTALGSTGGNATCRQRSSAV